jgi:serine/threonine-protein kinase HipA
VTRPADHPALWSTVKGIRIADVYKGDRLAATLTRSDDGVRFRYRADYLADPGPPVASTLPLTDEPQTSAAGAVPAFFAGLLPEGRRLASLRRAVKTSADDELSLLLAVGADPVGDVRVVPENAAPTAVESLVTVARDFGEITFEEVLGAAGVVDPVAVAGVQDKASARMLSVPIARAGRRYLLKIDSPEYPHLVENEHYFIGLAARSRLPVVRAEVVFDATNRSGLLVERFDRISRPDGTMLRLPVEDAAQALGIYPADKYSVTAERAVGALADLCAAGPLAVRGLFSQMCFAWLTGNGDWHAKNFSVVAEQGEWRVSPAYDLPSTLPYSDNTMALSVGGRYSGISRRRLIEFSSRLGLNDKTANQVVDAALVATEPMFGEWPAGRSPFRSDLTADVLRVLRHRRRATSAVAKP